MVLWRPTKPFRLTPKRDILFITGDWNAKIGSQEIPGVTGIWPWNTKWSRAKAKRVLSRECTGHSKTLFQQYKWRLYTWTSPDGQYRNQIDYILCSQRWRSCIQSEKSRPGVDCGSNHELLIAKFRLKLKKLGKNHWAIQVWPKSNPLWLYSGSDKQIQRIRSDRQSSKELWTEVHNTVQEVVPKTIPKKKKHNIYK